MVISADTWEQGEYYTKDFDLISSDIYIYLQFKVSESGPQLLQPGLIRQNRWSSQGSCMVVYKFSDPETWSKVNIENISEWIKKYFYSLQLLSLVLSSYILIWLGKNNVSIKVLNNDDFMSILQV